VPPSGGGDSLAPSAARFEDRSAPARRPGSTALYAYLLDLDDDLAQDIEVRMRFSARQHATARRVDAEPGDCDLSSWFAAAGDGPGLLILEGLLAAETQIADRTVMELLGSGDLVQPPCRREDDMIAGGSKWRALSSTRLALLDTEFLERVRSWPQISRALFQRAERRAADSRVLRAISCQPKLEVRLVLLLWHLGARWGRVEPTGLRLSLPLTHRLLGELVAAERPSISHALRRLSEAGIVTGSAGDWHLHGAVDSHIDSLIDRTAQLAPREHTRRRSRQRIA
jgi:CRP/FNR family transcriptional regulator, cyclic AMP receptor protein